MDEVTITVDRLDLEKVLFGAARYGGDFIDEARQRIEAAIPEPEWEPSKELTDLFRTIMWPLSRTDALNPVAYTYLKKLHEAGFEVTLTSQ